MAEERPIVIRFVGEDKVTTVANKVTDSVEDVGKSAGRSSRGLSELVGNLGNVTSAAGLTGGAVGGISAAIGAMGGPIGIAVGAIVGLGAAVFTLGADAARTADRVNNLKRGIISLSESQESGEALYQTLIDIAARTPFEREDVIEMGRSLLGAGIEAQKIPDYIYAIGDAVTTIGGDAQTIDSITTAIGRMQMSNKLSYEQMVQIQENGIPVFRLFAEATGLSTQEVIRLSQEGLLPADTNLNTLIQSMTGQYGDAMATQIGTATSATSNLNDAWLDLTTTIGERVGPSLASLFGWMTKQIEVTNDASKATLGLENSVKSVSDSLPDQTTAWGSFMNSMYGLVGYWEIYVNGNSRVIDSNKDVLQTIREIGYEALNTSKIIANWPRSPYEKIYGDAAKAAENSSKYGKEEEKLPYKIDDTADASRRAAEAERERERAAREAQQRQNELERQEQERLREVTNMTNDYNSRLRDLRDSYMDIADAERSVASAEKALRDAQDPLRLQQMALGLQSQRASLDDLNKSMSEMRTRRNEIAQALKGMSDEQIKYNALTKQEHQQMQTLDKDMNVLKKRRDEVRKALAGNKLTNEQRLEFLQTEQALNDEINDKQQNRQTLAEKQAEALKKAEEERLRLLEEDKRLRDDLEKSQLRYQQQLVSIAQAQRDLAEAQDPNRLNAYRDAVTKARNNLADLRAEQIADAVSANELASKLGITSEVMEVLALSARDTASPLDDLEYSSTALSKSVGGAGGTNRNIRDLTGNVGNLGDESLGSVKGLNDMGKSLGSMNQTFAVDKLSAPLGAIKDVASSITSAEADAFSKWSDAYTRAVNASAMTSNITNLVKALGALRDATNGTSSSTSGSGSGGNRRSMPMQSSGSRSVPIFGNGLSMAQPATQNITIHLHYASAPNSKNPLKDVEDYLAAQGGRLRI
jgi:tape measure domain-containing protein